MVLFLVWAFSDPGYKEQNYSCEQVIPPIREWVYLQLRAAKVFPT